MSQTSDEERASKLAEKLGTSPERLTESHDGKGTTHQPIIEYLDNDEIIKHIFTARRNAIALNNKHSSEALSGDGSPTYVFTDSRILGIMPKSDDEIYNISYQSIESAENHFDWSKWRMELEASGETYHLWINASRNDKDAVKSAKRYVVYLREISSIESKLSEIDSLIFESELRKAESILNEAESQLNSIKNDFPEFQDIEKVEKISRSIAQRRQKINFEQEIHSIQSKISQVDSLISESKFKTARYGIKKAESQFNAIKNDFSGIVDNKEIEQISRIITQKRREIKQNSQDQISSPKSKHVVSSNEKPVNKDTSIGTDSKSLHDQLKSSQNRNRERTSAGESKAGAKSEQSNEETREEMINTIQSLHDRLDRVPKSTDLTEDGEYSRNDFYTEFGSWDKTLEAAGINEEQASEEEGSIETATENSKNSRIEYLKSKRGVSSNTESIDTKTNSNERSKSSHSQLRSSNNKHREHKSIHESKAGTKSEEFSEDTREEMLNTVRSLHDRLDRVPKSTELPKKHSPRDFYTKFGSWDEALEAAGIDKEQAILDEIERVAKKLGHIPTTTDIDKHDAYPASAYQSYFDSWDEALEQSGVKERFETKSRESSEERRKEMINTLQSLYNQLDRVPKPTELPENSKYSPHDFYTEFGSWDEALEAAGIDKKQALLEDLNQVAEEVGHVPKTSDVDKHGTYSYSMYSSYFDSLDEALQQSGVKERFETESREMINTVQSLYDQLDRVPKSTELPEKYSPHDFYTEFGSWDEALEAAGIDVEQAILDEIERVAEELGKIPTTGDIHNYAEYPASNYQSHFDSWDEALQQSGVKERFETKSRESSEEMINTLQSLYNQLDRVPKTTELPENSKYSPHDFYTEFGSWDEALKAAGIDKKQALLEDLNQVAEEVGHVPKTSDVDKHGTYSSSVYSSYFDSLDEALQQSGVKERFETESRESSEERRKEMINTLQSLHNELDRVPKSTELPEKYSSRDFYTEFGSWDEALEAAGIDKKQAILDGIERVAKKLGRIPTITDINKHGAYPVLHYQSYFDSWDEALRESGVKEMFETKSKKPSDSIESDNEFPPSSDEIEKLLEIRGVRRPTARRILETFGTVDEATSAPTHELTEIRGVGQRIAARITSKAGRQTGPDHNQPTTTAESETSPEKKDNDSIEILDKIANEFEEL